jgi:predicted nucleotidyltransferase
MTKIGIICEYNPFHNGHKYHIDKIKEMFPDSIIILALSPSFTQRGDVSIINKWDKTKIAIENGVNLVVEIPTKFVIQ